MASDNFVQPAIPRFDGHYDHWAMLMENFMRSKDFWNVIETGVAEPATGTVVTEQQKTELELLKMKDLKAKNYLFQAIDRAILETILCKDTSKHIWDSMKKKFEGNARAKRSHLQGLRSEFETLRMKSGESVMDFFGRTMALANKMRIHGEKMGDTTIIEKILRSLTPKFNFVVCSIEESKFIDDLTIDELQSSLLIHEQKLTRQEEEEQALKASVEHHSFYKGDRGRGRGRGRGHGRGRSDADRENQQPHLQKTQFRSRGRGRGGHYSVTQRPTGDKSKVECYRCHRYGHYQSECRVDLSHIGERSNFAEKEEEVSLLMTCHLSEEMKENKWYLDTGCSNHMCGDKKLFSEFDESFRSTVKFGDHSMVPVMGQGKVPLLSKRNSAHSISDVYYVPDLKTNLLSVGQLLQKGYELDFKNGGCRISDAKLGLVAQVKMSSNRLFPLSLNVIQNSCLTAKVKDLAWLWHFRFGHLSFGGLNTLLQKEMVRGLPQLRNPSQVCEECVVSKQHRAEFPKGKSWRAKSVLELVHSDLCGPITPTSNGGKRYVITFIDDFSRKAWVYFLREKSEAFEAFKSFKLLVEKETGSSIKCFRTDRGGEYMSKEFLNFCDNHGIRRQLTAAYSPQQNGVSERKNRTIMDMVRSLLKMSGVPRSFWPEAVNWSIHILNRSPTFSVKNMTPEEAWSGHKPSVDYFRIFGCVAYAHVPDQLRRKLDDKGVKCIFLGVSEQSKAYKLYDPVTKKILISRDVVFDEDRFGTWNNQTATSPIQVSFDENDDVRQQPAQGDQQPVQTDEDVGLSSENNAQSPDVATTSPEGRPIRSKRRPGWMTSGEYEVTGRKQVEDPVTHFALFSDCDPTEFEVAVKDPKWCKAMDEEIASIERNNTWELTELPPRQKAIGVKWVYKTKLKENGEVEKYKARLVAKGYKQEYGVDYKEVFAPVARHDTIRLVTAMAAQNSWPIFQLDVKSAFLYGELEEEVYVEQPPGYVKSGYEHMVYKLIKALYGLHQAPRAWYGRIDAYFLKQGFTRCPYDHSLYVKHGAGGKLLITCLYVDDLIFTGNDYAMFDKFKTSMMEEFDMSDLGKLHYFLGIEVIQSEAGIFLTQRKYAQELLDKFQMKSCNSVSTPTEMGLKLVRDPEGSGEVDSTMYKQIVGSLMYLTATRPDIMHAVSLISRYMESPKEIHLLAAKRIFRYLKGTVKYGLLYKRGEKSDLYGFTDSDYAGDIDDRKSTSGYVFMLGSGAVSWSSRKQPIVTLSTTEAEYVAAAGCACQAIWMRNVLGELHFRQEDATVIYCDNGSAIKLSKNPVAFGKSKHIDVRYHFLRDLSRNGVVDLVYCKSENQVADIMTKPLKRPAFEKLRKLMGVCAADESS